MRMYEPVYNVSRALESVQRGESQVHETTAAASSLKKKKVRGR